MAASDGESQGGKNRHQGFYGEMLVASIAASAGCNVMVALRDDEFDLHVTGCGPKGSSDGRQIGFQVKSWSVGALKPDGYFHYPLKVSNYNFLASKKNDVRQYLALCIVPKVVSEYTDARFPRLVHRYAAYWLSLLGEDLADESVSPESTKTVYVPTWNPMIRLSACARSR